ncbi:hypothetical protein D9Q98_001911 [Chlorella vulgaris]|uniref:MHD domain-containing protein n=1 Tax=Chlorella vulgaris TaxID=3077 RepID=A0A9D4Z0E7_CHLVU|nr:hypothetical protein D9Q98_001911 [Chlorella vulgaris]
MVAGIRLALVLRAKDGTTNLLIQTHGVSGRATQDASNEVAAIIAKFAAAGGKGNIDGTGDNPPGVGTGHMAAVQGRYSVTYRLVNRVYAMVVAPAASNVFLSMQLLDAAAKVLVGVSRGVDVTPAKVAKRYTEVYMLLEDLVATGLSTLPPAFMHSSATDERLLVLPSSAADAARRLKRMVRGGAARGAASAVTSTPSKGGEAEGGSNDPTPPPVPETPTSRGGSQFSAAHADPLGSVAFDIPPDALPPPPARAAVARRTAAAALLAAAPQRPTPPPPAFQGAVDERAAGVAADSEGFGAFGDVTMLEAEKAAAAPQPATAEQEWAQFGDAEAAGASDVAVAAEQAAPPAAPKPSLPAITPKDVKDSLQLTEVWRAEVAGGAIVRAGVEGGVRRKLAPYGLPLARFRLLPSPAGAVNACLRVAALNRDFAQQLGSDGEGGFEARFTQASVGCCYLQYTLPAVACPPPLQVLLHVVPGADTAKAGGWQGLVVLRYVASPHLPGALLDVTVDLNLPAEAATLVRVSPSAQWSRDAGQLRWQLPRMAPGAGGELRAVFGCKAGVTAAAATAALQRQAEARLLFSLRPGKSLSGVGLQVAAPEPEAAYMAGNAQCFGEMTVRL